MNDQVNLPVGVTIRSNVEYRPDRAKPYKARVRWTDPATKRRPSTSESFVTEDAANAWVARMERAAARGLDPAAPHRIIVVRLRWHQPTRDYLDRRLTEGETTREIIRCLKRYLACEIHAALCPPANHST